MKNHLKIKALKSQNLSAFDLIFDLLKCPEQDITHAL